MTLALLKSERQNDSFLNGTRKKQEKARGSIEGNGDGERGNTQMTIRVVNIKRFRTYNYFHDCFISQYFDQLVNDLFKHKSGQNALHQFQEHRMTSVKWLIKTVKKKKKSEEEEDICELVVLSVWRVQLAWLCWKLLFLLWRTKPASAI